MIIGAVKGDTWSLGYGSYRNIHCIMLCMGMLSFIRLSARHIFVLSLCPCVRSCQDMGDTGYRILAPLGYPPLMSQ